jgi:hypothetical protein
MEDLTPIVAPTMALSRRRCFGGRVVTVDLLPNSKPFAQKCNHEGMAFVLEGVDDRSMVVPIHV